jgi:hypothetical protein
MVSLLQNPKNPLRPFGKLSAQGERYLDYSIRGKPVEPQLILLQEALICALFFKLVLKLFVDLIDKGQDLGDRPIEFGRDFLS